MPATSLVGRALTAGWGEDLASVASLPGEDNPARVLRFASSLRSDRRSTIDAMTKAELTAFLQSA